MKLSTKGRYAVMAMSDLVNTPNDRPIPLADIALRQGLSVAYLEQLFVKLRREGLVASTRGQTGGYTLASDPAEIKILDIMLAVDEPIHATRCNPDSNIGCQGTSSRCMTHKLWQGLGEHLAGYLQSVTLADLKAES